MLALLMMVGIVSLVLFVLSCRRDEPSVRHISLGLLSIAGVSLLLAGLGFAFSNPFPVTDLSLDAMKAARDGQTSYTMAVTVQNFFVSMGSEGNAVVWGGLGAICLRSAWTGSWDRFAGCIRKLGGYGP